MGIARWFWDAAAGVAGTGGGVGEAEGAGGAAAESRTGKPSEDATVVTATGRRAAPPSAIDIRGGGSSSALSDDGDKAVPARTTLYPSARSEGGGGERRARDVLIVKGGRPPADSGRARGGVFRKKQRRGKGKRSVFVYELVRAPAAEGGGDQGGRGLPRARTAGAAESGSSGMWVAEGLAEGSTEGARGKAHGWQQRSLDRSNTQSDIADVDEWRREMEKYLAEKERRASLEATQKERPASLDSCPKDSQKERRQLTREEKGNGGLIREQHERKNDCSGGDGSWGLHDDDDDSLGASGRACYAYGGCDEGNNSWHDTSSEGEAGIDWWDLDADIEEHHSEDESSAVLSASPPARAAVPYTALPHAVRQASSRADVARAAEEAFYAQAGRRGEDSESGSDSRSSRECGRPVLLRCEGVRGSNRVRAFDPTEYPVPAAAAPGAACAVAFEAVHESHETEEGERERQGHDAVVTSAAAGKAQHVAAWWQFGGADKAASSGQGGRRKSTSSRESSAVNRQGRSRPVGPPPTPQSPDDDTRTARRTFLSISPPALPLRASSSRLPPSPGLRRQQSAAASLAAVEASQLERGRQADTGAREERGRAAVVFHKSSSTGSSGAGGGVSGTQPKRIAHSRRDGKKLEHGSGVESRSDAGCEREGADERACSHITSTCTSSHATIPHRYTAGEAGAGAAGRAGANGVAAGEGDEGTAPGSGTSSEGWGQQKRREQRRGSRQWAGVAARQDAAEQEHGTTGGGGPAQRGRPAYPHTHILQRCAISRALGSDSAATRSGAPRGFRADEAVCAQATDERGNAGGEARGDARGDENAGASSGDIDQRERNPWPSASGEYGNRVSDSVSLFRDLDSMTPVGDSASIVSMRPLEASTMAAPGGAASGISMRPVDASTMAPEGAASMDGRCDSRGDEGAGWRRDGEVAKRANSLSVALRNSATVEHLDLTASDDLQCTNLMCPKVTEPCICRLGVALSRLPRLTSLTLAHNGLEALPDSLSSLTTLRHLDLSHNRLSSAPLHLTSTLPHLT
ncbi:unnamed protein product, partial [Closterium sp. Naga37s-1]